MINTPSNEASKFWIGGAAATAKICAVFAQLTVAGRWEGPHVFVVRMRDDAGNMMPGERRGGGSERQWARADPRAGVPVEGRRSHLARPPAPCLAAALRSLLFILRRSGRRALAGVRASDNGPKMGLNGVDNGQIWFDREPCSCLPSCCLPTPARLLRLLPPSRRTPTRCPAACADVRIPRDALLDRYAQVRWGH